MDQNMYIRCRGFGDRRRSFQTGEVVRTVTKEATGPDLKVWKKPMTLSGLYRRRSISCVTGLKNDSHGCYTALHRAANSIVIDRKVGKVSVRGQLTDRLLANCGAGAAGGARILAVATRDGARCRFFDYGVGGDEQLVKTQETGSARHIQSHFMGKLRARVVSMVF